MTIAAWCRKQFLLLILILSPIACADQSAEKSAALLCELYNPDTWTQLDKNASAQEIYAHIALQQEQVIENEAVKAILENADNSTFASYFHSVTNGLKAMLGKPWECSNFERFYLPKQRVVSLSLNGVSEKRIDPQAENVVTVMLAADGNVLINNSPLASSKSDQIEKAITSVAGTQLSDHEFVLYFDSLSDGGRVAGILRALANVGVKTVDIIEY